MNAQTLIDWIQIATIGVLIATTIIQGKRISNLENEVTRFEHRLSRTDEQHNKHEDLFGKLVRKLGMRVEAKKTETGYPFGPFFKTEERIVELTDKEKRAEELREEADRLEEEAK